MTEPGTLPSRRYRIEWTLLVTALLVLGALVGYGLSGARNRVETLERDRLQVQARVIDENMGRLLEGMNNALAGVRNDYPPSIGKSIGLGASRHLKALVGAMPGVRTMLILDAEGSVLATSRDDLIGMNFGQREYFRVPREQRDPATLYISPPYKSVLGAYSINVVRVATSSSGEFAGIVSATLDPEYFNVLLKSVLYASDMRVAIAHGDGVALLYVPADQRAAGTDLAKPGSFFTRHRDSGQVASVMTGTVYTRGDERMVAVRTIRPASVPMDKPLVVAVGRDLAAIYALWRIDAFIDGGLYGVIALTTTVGLYITQRRRRKFDRLEAEHEKQRRETAEQLELALHGGDLGLWDWHVRSGEGAFDARWCAILGHGPGELVPNATTWRERVHPDDWPVIQASLDPHLKGETPGYESEHRMRHKDGHWIWVLGRGKVVERDHAGAPLRMVGTQMDITVRKRAEQELRASEAKFRSLAEEALAGVVIIQDDRFKYVNPAMTGMLGRTREELLAAASTTEFVVEEDRAKVEEKLRLRQDGDVQRARYFFRCWRKDGTLADLEVLGTRIPYEGRFAVMSTVLDVTERKRAEAEREQFTKLFAVSLDMMCLVGTDGHFKRVNAACTRILGYTEAELLQMPYMELVVPQDRPALQMEIERNANGGPTFDFETRCLCKDGSECDVMFSAIFDREESLIYATAHDITNRKRTEQELQRIATELRQAYRRLAQAQDAEQRNLAKELHDQVGQNLSALSLTLTLVERVLPEESRAKLQRRLEEAVGLVGDTTERIRNLLGMLRPPMLDDYGLYATLRWWAHETTHLSGIECTLEGAEPAGRLPAEIESALVRIAQEALMNATKYSKARRITMTLRAAAPVARLEIADDGVGFDPALGRRADAKPTWGIMTMRERAAGLGGQLQIASTPGTGTRVVAEIPLAPE